MPMRWRLETLMRTTPLLLLCLASHALVACGDKASETDAEATDPGDTATPVDDGDDTGGSGETDDTGDTGETEPDPVDADGDGYFDDEDCDDANADAYPGAPEWADGVDTDCDGDASDPGLATWWDASGPVDVAADILAGRWEAPGEGSLYVGAGTWSVWLVTPDATSVDILGAGALGDTVLQGLSGTAVEHHGTGTVANFRVEDARIAASTAATVTFENIDLTGGAVNVYFGATATIRNAHLAGDQPITRVSDGSANTDPSTVVLEDSTVTATREAIYYIHSVDVLRSTITSGADGTGTAIYNADSIALTDSTVNADLTAILLGADQSASLTNTHITAGKWGVAVFGSSGPVSIQGGAVDATEQALILRGVVADLTNTTLSSAVGPTMEASSYGSVDGEITLDGVELEGGTAGAATFGSLDVLDVDNSTFTGSDTPGLYFSGLSSTTTVNLRTSTFSGFETTGSGGAIDAHRIYGALWVEGCTFDDNEAAGNGGAIAMTYGSLLALGNTYSNNVAGGSGGALYVPGTAVYASNGDVFEANQASTGGGLYLQAATNVDAPVFHRNVAAVGAAMAIDGAVSINGAWDFGVGVDDNIGDDVYLMGNGSSWELDSGSNGFLCGDTACLSY